MLLKIWPRTEFVGQKTNVGGIKQALVSNTPPMELLPSVARFKRAGVSQWYKHERDELGSCSQKLCFFVSSVSLSVFCYRWVGHVEFSAVKVTGYRRRKEAPSLERCSSWGCVLLILFGILWWFISFTLQQLVRSGTFTLVDWVLRGGVDRVRCRTAL